jgi:hypothetical protein
MAYIGAGRDFFTRQVKQKATCNEGHRYCRNNQYLGSVELNKKSPANYMTGLFLA